MNVNVSEKVELKIKESAVQKGQNADDFAGSSFKPETLRFGALGTEAPDVDLSSYLMNFQIGKAKFSLGHTSYGGNRHLVNSFSSRGLSSGRRTRNAAALHAAQSFQRQFAARRKIHFARTGKLAH